MGRYALLVFKLRPFPGWSAFRGSFDTIEEATATLRIDESDYWIIVDMRTNVVVATAEQREDFLGKTLSWK